MARGGMVKPHSQEAEEEGAESPPGSQGAEEEDSLAVAAGHAEVEVTHTLEAEVVLVVGAAMADRKLTLDEGFRFNAML